MRKTDYHREKAVSYAHKWAYGRNPQYYNFDRLGGDCTNFASQVLYAGSGVMNPKPTFGWYYYSLNNRAPAWTGVEFLHNFLVKNQGIGPVAAEVDISQVEPGDIVQLSFDGMVFSHSPTIVAVGATPLPSNILVAAHTFDTDNRPLNTYQYVSIRYLHITHVNAW
ncbi:MAG: amidase domain-containing protein [Anaerotignum sp.]|nr:amidase domain-containing protein [Anaerotignum sp.]